MIIPTKKNFFLLVPFQKVGGILYAVSVVPSKPVGADQKQHAILCKQSVFPFVGYSRNWLPFRVIRNPVCFCIQNTQRAVSLLFSILTVRRKVTQPADCRLLVFRMQTKPCQVSETRLYRDKKPEVVTVRPGAERR